MLLFLADAAICPCLALVSWKTRRQRVAPARGRCWNQRVRSRTAASVLLCAPFRLQSAIATRRAVSAAAMRIDLHCAPISSSTAENSELAVLARHPAQRRVPAHLWRVLDPREVFHGMSSKEHEACAYADKGAKKPCPAPRSK